MRKNIIIGIVSVVLLGSVLFPVFYDGDMSGLGVTQDRLIAKMDGASFAKQFINQVFTRQLESVKASLASSLQNDQFDEKFKEIVGHLPSESPKSIKFIGGNFFTSNGASTVQFTLEYEFRDKWILASAGLEKQGERYRVLGFHFQPIKDSLESLTRYTFWGKSAGHYLVFALALLLLSFDLYAFVLCINTPIPKRKWLWIAFILTGFAGLSFDWQTGSFGGFEGANFTVFSFPVVRFSQMLYQPFLITLTVPIGAILFYLFVKRFHHGIQSQACLADTEGRRYMTDKQKTNC